VKGARAPTARRSRPATA